MTPRHLSLCLVALVACNRGSGESFLTPPPPPLQVIPEAQQPAQQQQGAQPQPTAGERAQPARPQGGPEEIRASHVLVMHRDSMRRPDTVTRSKDEARARAQDVLRRARAGEDFAALARQFSDEPGADRSNGDLNRFRRGMMVGPFEEAAFALSVGQISDIVETPFGFHIIKRTE